MTKHRYAGIYLDHAKANIIEMIPGGVEVTVVESAFTHEVKEKDLHEGESKLHHAEQHKEATYYKNIGEHIRAFTEVLVFGPSHAKDELFNIISADHRFANIKLAVKHADKLTPNQQNALVRDYFSAKNV